ncbi:hypothetical protein BG55_00995 [Erwinia mallotivora]|uniref:Uncharacterized protein n=1 Tax=Erwinia mallotivora TaxID=69222 RepID=A0A014MGL8_9GAMM|nr:hypothetical protein BG55_00995 [Erwinia mallotivora]
MSLCFQRLTDLKPPESAISQVTMALACDYPKAFLSNHRNIGSCRDDNGWQNYATTVGGVQQVPAKDKVVLLVSSSLNGCLSKSGISDPKVKNRENISQGI